MDDDLLDEEEAQYRQKKPLPFRNYSSLSQFPRAHHPPPSDSDDSSDRNLAEDNDDEDSEDDDDVTDRHSGSSHDSRGKRRKLDRFAHGFEFAPRKPVPPPPPPPPATTTLPPPEARNPKPGKSSSPPDWSEDSTFLLLEAWGDLFVQNGRKSLRSDEWNEVAKKVNQASRIIRSDSQCRNRLDTLKKKYKKEKIRLTEYPDLKSDWIYYAKMDSLMSGPALALPPVAVRLPCGVDAGEYVFSSDRVYMNRANGMEEMRDSPGDTGTEDDDDDEEEDDSDGLPPATNNTPALKRRGENSNSSNSASFRLLADSIRKFGEVYEKVEVSKRQQMVELERMRNDFQRDLEVQKRQILERAQAEIARMSQDEGEEEEEGDEERTDDDNNNNNGGGVGGGGDEDDDDDINGSAENMSG